MSSFCFTPGQQVREIISDLATCLPVERAQANTRSGAVKSGDFSARSFEDEGVDAIGKFLVASHDEGNADEVRAFWYASDLVPRPMDRGHGEVSILADRQACFRDD
ncbi:MAG: hypothetical protein BGO20_11560 [Bosea sp. 67-29]|nr:MAG: hypothetical protein BGO20_11560 [Bosea sp. 67-29]